jgi:hypothetical protein
VASKAYYVLPYAIEQKDRKYHRKAVGAVPVWMLDQDSDVLTPLLMTKLAST